eukprot:scaffold49116_cov33-Tisochrysis_lutea.AAC.2
MRELLLIGDHARCSHTNYVTRVSSLRASLSALASARPVRRRASSALSMRSLIIRWPTGLAIG